MDSSESIKNLNKFNENIPVIVGIHPEFSGRSSNDFITPVKEFYYNITEDFKKDLDDEGGKVTKSTFVKQYWTKEEVSIYIGRNVKRIGRFFWS